MKVQLRWHCAVFGAIFGVLACGPVHAQSRAFPVKPVRLIVPYAPGSPLETAMRATTAEMSKNWGQPIVIENRPGASATIGADACAKSAPDGYTVCVLDRGNLVYTPYLMKSIPYDPARDIEPVARLFDMVSVMVVGAQLPIKSMEEMAAYAKARPGVLNYGSVGEGTSPHVIVESIKGRLGLNVVHIPYAGPPPVMQALMAGDLHMTVLSVASSAGLIRSGKLRAIAQSGTSRSPVVPTVPTFPETGLNDIDDSNWFALFAPARVPKDVTGRYYEELERVFAMPELREQRFVNQGFNPALMPGAETAAFISADRMKAGRIVKELGLIAK